MIRVLVLIMTHTKRQPMLIRRITSRLKDQTILRLPNRPMEIQTIPPIPPTADSPPLQPTSSLILGWVDRQEASTNFPRTSAPGVQITMLVPTFSTNHTGVTRAIHIAQAEGVFGGPPPLAVGHPGIEYRKWALATP